MKKLKVVAIILGLTLAPYFVSAYINDYKTWINNEVLTHTDLNANFTKTNTALDEIVAVISDSLAANSYLFQKQADFNDSFYASIDTSGIASKNLLVWNATTKKFENAMVDSSSIVDGTLSVSDIANGANGFALKTDDALKLLRANFVDSLNAYNLLPKSAVRDSIKARYQATDYLNFMLATADSNAANDSLNVEVTCINPLGTKQAALFHNLAGVNEGINLRWIFKLPNQYALLDSIHWFVWTETTTTNANFGIITVFRDSTETERKVLATATSDTVRSLTARTARQQGLVLNYVPGTEEIMVKLYVYGIADTTAIISRPRLFWTNR